MNAVNTPKLAIAMNYIDDDLISGAMDYKPAPKKANIIWFRHAIIAVCMCLAVVGVFRVLPYENWFEHQAEDPNWEKTHYETATRSDIEAVCGTDLLLDKMTLTDSYFSHYNLEIIENGSFENTADWESLSVDVNYGDSVVDQDSDNLFCFISFDGSTDGIYIPDFLTDAATVEVNGYTVEYNEMSSDEAAADGWTLGSKLDYHGWAKFTHNGYTYYIATNSDNPDFFELTLEQMLK